MIKEILTTRELQPTFNLIYQVYKHLQNGPRTVFDAGEFPRVLKLPDWPRSTFLKLLFHHQRHQQPSSTKNKEIQAWIQLARRGSMRLWTYPPCCCQKHYNHSDTMQKHKQKYQNHLVSFTHEKRDFTVPTGHRAWSPTGKSRRAQPTARRALGASPGEPDHRCRPPLWVNTFPFTAHH